MAKRSQQYPRKLPKKWKEDFIAVTQDNKKELLVIGRVYHYIDIRGMQHYPQYIPPRHKRGAWTVKNDPICGSHSYYYPEEEPVVVYQERLISVIGWHIRNKNIYIKKDEPLVTFNHTP